MASEQATSSRATVGILIVVLLVAALTVSKNQPDPDFWGHVQYGRDALATGLPETTTYSYTAVGHRWINHENLSELLFAVGVDTIGPRGLLAIKLLLAVGLFGVMLVRAERQGASQLTLVVMAMFVAINLMHFWVLRPQLLSYVLFAALVMALNRAFADWSERVVHWRALWLCPLILAVWANTHGAFLAGFAVLSCYLMVRGVESGRDLLHFSGVIAVSGAATLLTPYGIELHQWLLASLGTPRPEIIEWRAPELLHVAWLPWWLLVALFAVALITRLAAWPTANAGADSTQLSTSPLTDTPAPPSHATAIQSPARGPLATRLDKKLATARIDLAHLLVMLLVLWQAVEHRRHIPFFVILFGFWMAPHVDRLLRAVVGRERKPTDENAPASRGWLPQLAPVAATLLLGTLLAGQLRAMPVLRGEYPVSAFQYMADRQLTGKLLLRFMWAQYAIAAFGTESASEDGMQVAFDGRFRTCYPQEVVDMYFDFALGEHPSEPRQRDATAPPIDGRRILDHKQPDLVLVDRRQPHAASVMAASAGDWVLLYQDQLAQLWGRASKYDRPDSSDYIPPTVRQLTDQPQEGFVPWPALPRFHR